MTSANARRPAARGADLAQDLQRWLATSPWPQVVRWWNAQEARIKVAVLIAGLVVVIGMLNLVSAATHTAARGSAAATVAPSASAPALVAEAAPADAGKAWVVTRLWQGSGNRETESFTVSGHWRVDWLFSPAQRSSTLQVFIYAADGRLLMNLAANTQSAGADTSFWAGPGTYFLKVNTTGDWKLDVQELR